MQFAVAVCRSDCSQSRTDIIERCRYCTESRQKVRRIQTDEHEHCCKDYRVDDQIISYTVLRICPQRLLIILNNHDPIRLRDTFDFRNQNLNIDNDTRNLQSSSRRTRTCPKKHQQQNHQNVKISIDLIMR